MTLLSRDGSTSMCFWNTLASQLSIVPTPLASSVHCWRTCGFSLSFKLRTTLSATRSLLMMSTCVAISVGEPPPPYRAAVIGSGLKSMTTLAIALYCLGSSRLTPRVSATVPRRIGSANHQRAFRIDRNWPNVISLLPQNKLSRTKTTSPSRSASVIPGSMT